MPLSSIFGRKRSNSQGGSRAEGSVSPALGGSSLSSLQSNGSMTSLASVSRSNSSAAHNTASRFEENLQGGHTHRLKNTRRQEKLGRMLREMVGERKKVGDDAVSAVELMHQGGHQLSLMSGLVNKINNGQVQVGGIINGSSNGPKKGTPTVEQDQIDNFDIKRKCLAEKYGKCQEVIGKGSYGIVRVAHRLDKDGKEVLYAVKEFRKRSQEDEEQYKERLMSEFCISSALRHHNIVDTLDLMQDAHGSFCEVMEYCPGGDLYSLILSTGTGLVPHEADCFFKQILRGVVYMHSMGVAHCDLKPENILLTQDGICKISDFGNGECFRMAWEKKIHLSNGVCGSGPYIAPEEFKNKPFDPRAVDIWAMGIIYMVMRTGSYLWRTASQDEDENYHAYLVDRKTSKGYAPIEKLGYSKCVYVIYSILDPVPTRRITGKQILNSEWGRGIRVCEAGEASLHEPPLRVDESMASPGLEGLKSVAKHCPSGSKPASTQSSIASTVVSPATSTVPSPANTRPQSPALTRSQSPANPR